MIWTAEKNSQQEWKAQRFLKQSQGSKDLQIPCLLLLLQSYKKDQLQQLLGKDTAVSLAFILGHWILLKMFVSFPKIHPGSG